MTGQIEFSPLLEQLGDFTVTIDVFDLAGLSDTQSYLLTIDQAYTPPTIVSEPDLYGVVGNLYSYQPVVAADPSAILQFEILHQPNGLQIDANTGLIEWLIPAEILGSYANVAFKVVDQFGNVDTQQFRLHGDVSNLPPTITSTPVTRVADSTNGIYNYNLAVDDANFYEEISWATNSSLTDMYVEHVPQTFISNNNYKDPFDRLTWSGQNYNELVHEPLSLTHRQCKISDPLQSVNPVTDWSKSFGLRGYGQPLIATLAEILGSYANVAFKVVDQFGNVDTQQFRLHGDVSNLPPTITSTPVTRVADSTNGIYNYNLAVDDANFYEEISWATNSSLTDMYVEHVPQTFISNNNYKDPFDRLTWSGQNYNELVHEPLSLTHRQCKISDPLQSVNPVTDWSKSFGLRGYGQPLIAPLADTNGNGLLDDQDESFLFVASRRVFRGSSNSTVLHVLDLNGNPVWNLPGNQMDWDVIPAIADLDGDLQAEVILKTSAGEILVLDNSGQEKWRSTAVSYPLNIFAPRPGAVTLADLDGDGDIEILVGGTVLDHQGNLLWQIPDTSLGHSVAHAVALPVDLDGDGQLEVLYNNAAYDNQGTQLWQMNDSANNTTYRNYYFALVNADLDDQPEVVAVSQSLGNLFNLSLYDNDGTKLWQVTTESSGPLNIVDIDRDGIPEIINPSELAAYDLLGNEIWRRTDVGDLTARGAALADLNQDGELEVIVSTSPFFKILDAGSGTDLIGPLQLSEVNGLAQPIVYSNLRGESAILHTGDSGIRSLIADTGPMPLSPVCKMAS